MRHDAAVGCSGAVCAMRLTCARAARQIGGLAREDDYEYLGQDGFCRDRKHGGDADAALTQLKVRCNERLLSTAPLLPVACALRSDALVSIAEPRCVRAQLLTAAHAPCAAQGRRLVPSAAVRRDTRCCRRATRAR